MANPKDQACVGMGKLPRGESNVLLALSSNNIPAHGSVPHGSAHNQGNTGEERCRGAPGRGGQVQGKAAFLETLGHACADAMPPTLDPKHLLNSFSAVSACTGGVALQTRRHCHACGTAMGNRNRAGKVDVAAILLPK